MHPDVQHLKRGRRKHILIEINKNYDLNAGFGEGIQNKNSIENTARGKLRNLAKIHSIH
jgi:hypothetical protein